ncbi:unnamed protein product, partial [Amoebophrya sp. A120]|eukprot:GSA120T00015592001.1
MSLCCEGLRSLLWTDEVEAVSIFIIIIFMVQMILSCTGFNLLEVASGNILLQLCSINVVLNSLVLSQNAARGQVHPYRCTLLPSSCSYNAEGLQLQTEEPSKGLTRHDAIPKLKSM